MRQGAQQAIATTVAGLGYELVDVERAARGLLRVTIDRIPGQAYLEPGEFITVDDCEKVTRQLQYVLEVEGLEYARLEVSSPGLDRPLRREADFRRFAGQAVRLELKQPFQGRKNWQGLLVAPEELAAAPDAPGPASAGGAGEPAAAASGAAAGPNWALMIKDGKAEQVLGFALNEVREARLVPQVDFKGRKARGPGADAAGPAAPAPAGANDGG